MVDVENLVIDSVNSALRESSFRVKVTSTQEPTPSVFPTVSVYEANNTSYRKTHDGEPHEHHVEVVYAVDVYSNKKSGAKQEAKDIFAIVDNVLQSFKFTRTAKVPDSNADKSIYRITARYEAVIAEGQTIGDNTVFQVYRG